MSWPVGSRLLFSTMSKSRQVVVAGVARLQPIGEFLRTQLPVWLGSSAASPQGVILRTIQRRRLPARRGLTLIEMMIAVVLTLLMMATVVTVFQRFSESVSNSRSTIEMTERVRAAQNRLFRDLEGITLTPIPPVSPQEGLGYFEYIEGPVGPIFVFASTAPVEVAEDGTDIPDAIDGLMTALSLSSTDQQFDPDTTVGDNDDILMFTTRSLEEPFVGRFTQYDPNTNQTTISTIESQVAEVAWFIRGTTLYRRALLVVPGGTLQPYDGSTARPGDNAPEGALTEPGFYGRYDISVHQFGGSTTNNNHDLGAPANPILVPNTLGDLTKREYRFGHQPFAFPHDARFWGRLGLPTLVECSSFNWPFPLVPDSNVAPPGSARITWASGIGWPYGNIVLPAGDPNTPLNYVNTPIPRVQLTPAVPPPNANVPETFDAWTNPLPWSEVDPSSGGLVHYQSIGGPGQIRAKEDAILTNVVGFDVKVWDPGAPVFLEDGTDPTSDVVAPGDPGYLRKLLDYQSTPGDPNLQPVSFGAYVDLNYMARLGIGGGDPLIDPPAYPQPAGAPAPQFHHAGIAGSQLRGTNPDIAAGLLDNPALLTAAQLTDVRASVYDTWSSHYEVDGLNQDGDGLIDEGTNGFDNDSLNGVDDPAEAEAPPPYPVPLRAIQVTIRVMEPDSRQIREVTVRQEFILE